MTEDEQDAARISAALKTLVEHFDAVTILACKHISGTGKTMTHQDGFGNIHARAGHIQEWLIKHHERARVLEQRQSEEDDDETE